MANVKSLYKKAIDILKLALPQWEEYYILKEINVSILLCLRCE